MEIVEYIKKGKQIAAIEFIKQIDTAILQLECFPQGAVMLSSATVSFR